MNIGIFNGVFDPIHNGHTAFARAAAAEAGLDVVYFWCEREPWHKKTAIPFADRSAMIELALAGDVLCRPAPFEPDGKHTVSGFLQLVDKHFKESDTIYLLMGGDVAESVHTWDGFDRLAARVRFIVGLRTEDDGETVVRLMGKELQAVRLQMVASPENRVSSTVVRQMSRAGEPIGKLVSPAVEEYIREHSLYQS